MRKSVTVISFAILIAIIILSGCVSSGSTARTAPASARNSPSTELLIQDLYSHDAGVNERAIAALGVRKDEQAIDPLIKILKEEKNEIVRNLAAIALGKIGNKRAVEPLIQTMNNDVYWIRAPAATALGDIGDKQAVDALLLSLKNDNNSMVRTEATLALGKIGDKRAVDAILLSLKNDDSYKVREAAATALGNIGDTRAVDPLINTLRTDTLWCGPAAATALGEIGDPKAINPLIEKLDKIDKSADALAKFGTPAVDPLIASLDGDGKLGAARALGLIKDKKAVKPLIEQLHPLKSYGSDGLSFHEVDCRREIVKALGLIGPDAKDAVPTLIDIIKTPAERKTYTVKGSVPVGAPRAAYSGFEIPMYEGGIGINLGAAQEAIVALGEIGDSRAVPALTELLKDENPTIQAASKDALKKING